MNRVAFFFVNSEGLGTLRGTNARATPPRTESAPLRRPPCARSATRSREQEPILALDVHAAVDGRRQKIRREAAHVVAAALQVPELRGRAPLRRLVPRDDDAGLRIAAHLPPTTHDVNEQAARNRREPRARRGCRRARQPTRSVCVGSATTPFGKLKTIVKPSCGASGAVSSQRATPGAGDPCRIVRASRALRARVALGIHTLDGHGLGQTDLDAARARSRSPSPCRSRSSRVSS